MKSPNLSDRCELALSAQLSLKAGVEKRTAAALEIRNLLDGVQGVLFEKARKHAKENMTWTIMVARLCVDANEGAGYQRLLEQELNRTSLIRRLSDVLKDREAGSLTNLENIWTQVLDHIYVTLSLVGFAK